MNTGVAHQNCPRNGKPGKAVPRQTLQSLTLVDLYDLDAPRYWFCEAPDCPIVYFDAQGITIAVDQLRVPVWQKQPNDPTVPVCYCRKLTPAMIQDEVAQTGQSTAVAHVSAIIQAGRCACDLVNPQGTCCLGNVRRVVQDTRR